jgi:hypothetical protein
MRCCLALLALTLSSCSDLSSIDNPAWRGLGEGDCSGTPRPCNARLDGRCGGCSVGYTERCHGPVFPHCSSLSGAACDADPVCAVSGSGFLSVCEEQLCLGFTRAQCAETPGCGYSLECSGPPTAVLKPCEDYELEMYCNAVSGCTWTPKGGDAGD